MLLGVDVGGTFTDAVLVDGVTTTTAKAPTTPADQSAGVLAAVDAAGATPADVTAFAHGMNRRDQRAPGGEGSSHGAPGHGGLRRARAPGAGGPLPLRLEREN